MKKIWMAGVGLGAMTAAERSKGRYMRAPDGHGDSEFAAFEAAGSVEVGSAKDGIETNTPDAEKPAEKPAGRRGPPKPATPAKPAKPATPAKPAAAAAEAGEDDEDEDEIDGEGEPGEGEPVEGEEGEKPAKPKQKASERIRDLIKRNSTQGRLIEQLSARLDVVEKGGLPAGKPGGNSDAEIGEAPDPSDEKLYPLGHLDDRYIEDKLEWLATKKAAERADAALQREQGNEQNRQAEAARTELLDKVDDLSTRGAEQFDDFQEAVVEAGMRGDWDLSQPTFEAAHEAENGAQILYDLSQDKKEASRVAKLSPYGQLKFVLDRDAEIGKTKLPRKIPGAGAPPATQTRGANSRTRISPTTDNLDDFEKAWEADAKGK